MLVRACSCTPASSVLRRSFLLRFKGTLLPSSSTGDIAADPFDSTDSGPLEGSEGTSPSSSLTSVANKSAGDSSFAHVPREPLGVTEAAVWLTRLKRSASPVPPKDAREIRESILRGVGDMQWRDAADILHACLKLNWKDSDLFTAVLEPIAEGHIAIDDFDDIGLAALVYTLGQCVFLWGDITATKGRDTPSPLMHAVRRVVAEIRANQRLLHMDKRQVVNILYGLGLAKCKDHVGTLADLVDVVFCQDMLPEFTEHQFSMFVTALDELELTVTDDQWKQLETELAKAERRSTFTEQGLVNVMRRLGCMEFPHKNILQLLAEESIAEDRMLRYNGQDLANLIHTIAVRDLDPGRMLEHFHTSVTRPKMLRNFKEKEICNVMYGLALGKTENTALFHCLGMEAVRKDRLPRHTEQGLAMIIYSFGMAKCHDYEVLEALRRECTQSKRLRSFSAQALCTMIYGLGRLRVEVPTLRRFGEALLAQASRHEHISAFTDQSLANVIYSLAQLKMPQFLSPFMDEVCKADRLAQVNDQGLSNIIQSIAWLKYTNNTKIKILTTEAAKRAKAGALSELATNNIMSAAVNLSDQMLAMTLLKRIAGKKNLKDRDGKALYAILDRYARADVREHSLISPVLIQLSKKIKTLSNEELVEVLRQIWKLGKTSSNTVQHVVQELFSDERWQTLSVTSTAKALIFLGWLQYPDQSIHSKLCQSLAADSVLEQLEAPDVISILQSLRPSLVLTDYVDTFVDYLSRYQQLHQLEDHQLTDLINFHVIFGLRNEARVTRCLQEMTSSRRLNRLNLKDVATALQCVVSLGLHELEEVPKLIKALENPGILDYGRVHYLAKAIIAVCRMGRDYKSTAARLVEILVNPPMSTQAAEKDLTAVLKVLKELKYEYGAVGRLLNRHRRQTKFSPFLTSHGAELEHSVV